MTIDSTKYHRRHPGQAINIIKTTHNKMIPLSWGKEVWRGGNCNVKQEGGGCKMECEISPTQF